jgi:hypothetical protein
MGKNVMIGSPPADAAAWAYALLMNMFLISLVVRRGLIGAAWGWVFDACPDSRGGRPKVSVLF